MRGSRMLTLDIYECTWGLFKSIPSLADPDKSVYEETVVFNERVKSNAKARLIDKNRAIVDSSKLGFSMSDRTDLLKLSEASEENWGIVAFPIGFRLHFLKPISGLCGERVLHFHLGIVQ